MCIDTDISGGDVNYGVSFVLYRKTGNGRYSRDDVPSTTVKGQRAGFANTNRKPETEQISWASLAWALLCVRNAQLHGAGSSMTWKVVWIYLRGPVNGRRAVGVEQHNR